MKYFSISGAIDLEVQVSNPPTWIIGPALGEKSLIGDPTDTLKVCPTRAKPTASVLSTDGYAAQMMAGALSVGNWNSVLGTTLALKGVTPDLIKDLAGAVYSHRSPDGNWLPGGASSAGAGSDRQALRRARSGTLETQAAEREPASVVTYPLHGRWERFPFIASEAAEGK